MKWNVCHLGSGWCPAFRRCLGNDRPPKGGTPTWRAAIMLMCWVGVTCSVSAQTAAQTWTVPSARYRVSVEKAGDAAWPAAVGYAVVTSNGGDARNAVATVVNAEGKMVGSQTLWAATGEPVKVLFDTSSGEASYYIYVGEARLPLAPNWKPEAGVVLETRKKPPGVAESWAEFKKMWEAAPGAQGRSLVPNIFHGINPHGPTLDYLSFYRGYFPVKEAGEYTIAAVSDDASFLFIDGKLVVQWPGMHPAAAGARGQHNGKVTLAEGRHMIEYFHAQGDGESCAEAAWKRPGQERFEVMPAEAFLPAARFQVAAYEPSRLQPNAVYFDWRVLEHTVVDDQVLVTVELAAQPEAKGREYRWVFDDASAATGASVRHVFVRPGLHKVRLDLAEGNKRVGSMLDVVNVHHDWPQRDEWSDEVFSRQKQELLDRDFSGAAVDDLAYLVQLADRIHDEDLLSHIGGACMKRAAEFGAARAETFYRLGLHFQKPDVRQYALADKAFRVVLDANPPQPGLVDRTRLRLAAFLIHTGAGLEEGEQLLGKIDEKPLTNEERRLRQILVADAKLAHGDVDGARQGYLAVTSAENRSDVRAALRRRARLESAKAFVIKADYEAADDVIRQIEWEMPLERMQTETGLAMIQVHARRKEYPFALARCQRLLHAAETERARAELLFVLADINFTIGNNAMAKEVVAKLLKDHPYTEAAARAKDKWGS